MFIKNELIFYLLKKEENYTVLFLRIPFSHFKKLFSKKLILHQLMAINTPPPPRAPTL